MKVLIFDGDSFMGSHIADRLYKEGLDVICIYHRDKNMGIFPTVPHTKYRFKGNFNYIDKIIKNERPHAIIYNSLEPVQSLSELNQYINILNQVLASSVKYNCEKFIYISDISVYGSKKQIFAEDDEPSPETISAKCHAISEDAVFRWRNKENFSSVILRFPQIYGVRQEINNSNIVWKLFENTHKENFQNEIKDTYYLLNSGDAADAVYKSLGDFAEGIYNITPDEPTKGFELAKIICRLMNKNPPCEPKEFNIKPRIKNDKAKRELSFVNIVDLDRGIELCHNYYIRHKDYVYKPEKEKVKKEKRGYLFKFTETVVFFLLVALLTYLLAGWSTSYSLDFMTIYIIMVAVILGLDSAVLAAILSGAYTIFSSVMGGLSLVSALYNLSTMITVTEYLLIAVCVGYVIERKDRIIKYKDEEIASKIDDLDYIGQLYDEMSEIKAELEVRISEYEDSYGKIYNAIKRLDSLLPEEVLANALNVISELIREDNIAWYMVDNRSMFLRRIAFIGEAPAQLPKTLRLREYPKIENIVLKKEFYANSFLDPDMPSMIAPIVYENKVSALIVVDKIKFDKLSLYYVNLMRTIANLLNSALYRAQKYTSLSVNHIYVKDTPILTPKEFERLIEIKENMKKNTNYQYSLIQIKGCKSLKDKIETSFAIAKIIRSNDEIGLGKDNKLYIILSATSEKDSVHLMDRLSNVGIESELVNKNSLEVI